MPRTENSIITKSKTTEGVQLNSVSVVIPVFRNSFSLIELVQRINKVFAQNNISGEILLIDDASDDDSWSVIAELAKDRSNIKGYRFSKNRGQHTAALFGLAQTEFSNCIVMDADLQDRPEAIAYLIETHKISNAEVVFAGRIGKYQSWIRMTTSGIYRKFILDKLLGLPSSAGMFFLITRPALLKLFNLVLPCEPMIIGLIAAAELSCISIPVQRSMRVYGKSTYTELKRLRSAVRMLLCALFSEKTEKYALLNYINSVEVAECLNQELSFMNKCYT